MISRKVFRSFSLLILCFCSLLSAAQKVDLKKFEKSVYSQEGDDGIIEKIFDVIGTKSKFCVEFGAKDGHIESNTKYLREQKGWSGLLMDCGYENPSINLQKAFVTKDNINELFEKYNVPHDLDLLSIDIDGNDFYVWNALDSKYRPRLVVIEFNAFLKEGEGRVIPYDENFKWDRKYAGGIYFGASIEAMYKLGRKKGYSLVYVESVGNNLFFIPDELVKPVFKDVNNYKKLFSKIDPWRGDVSKNLSKLSFVSYREALKIGKQ